MNRPTRGKACILTLLFIIITAASAHGQNTFNTEQDVSNYLVTHDFCSGDTRISFKWETWWGEEGLYMYVIGRIYAGPMHILSYESERASLAGYNVDQFIVQLVVLPQRSCIYHLDEYYSARPNGKPKIAASSAASKNGSNHNQKTSSEPNKTQKPEYKLSVGAVDMGLSVKWASCNVGAQTPEASGDYYAWGETAAKGVYLLKTYNNHQTLNSVPLKDDVANITLGPDWRIPTIEEWEELINNCTWSREVYKNKTGYVVTSKKTGNRIFIPAAGFRNNDKRFNAEEFGYYWSSTLYPDNPFCAWGIYFNSDNVYKYRHYRYYGLSIRPVCNY